MEEMKSLGRSIGCASHLFRERADARMAKYDVTPLQAHVMVHLAHQGGKSTQQALGEHLRVKPSTVNGIVDRMVERELIVRSADEADARRRLVALTQTGQARLEQLHQEMRETERLLESAFTAEELAQFYALVNRMIQNLEEDRKKC
ncbi:MarR family transcriptional regulator [Oscillibacter sp.]|uniref:MarR family winged helix-turn-helix transcriptional regulator n=1 Tax=Oscillibacter sp. TaxID=1945593 RepID=UPI00289BB435|nr:MarR family transcriptional regulator [Oscillibacter sp.]